jgi:hypothetical protein
MAHCFPSNRFSIHLLQFVHPEDGSRTFLRYVGTYNRPKEENCFIAERCWRGACGNRVLSRGWVKGRFTHSMPCPCRVYAVPLPCRTAKGLECVFSIWFTQCGRFWFTLAMPRPCHALTMPFFSRPRHSTAVERRPVGYPPAFGFFRLPRGVPRRLLSEALAFLLTTIHTCDGKEW